MKGGQRGDQIALESSERPRCRGGAGDQYVVVSVAGVDRRGKPHHLLETSPDAITHHGVTEFFGGGEAKARGAGTAVDGTISGPSVLRLIASHRFIAPATRAHLDHEGWRRPTPTAANSEKL